MAFLLAVAAPSMVAAQAAGTAAAGVVVDRVAAVLNGHAITASEVQDAADFAQLSAGLENPRSPTCAAPTAAERQAALQHLIDGRLLLESAQTSGYPAADTAMVDQAVDHYRQLAGGTAALDSRLRACGLELAALRGFLGQQASILDFLDDRLGAAAEPDDADVRQYYQNVFLPEARSQGIAAAPYEAVRGQIAAILREQRLAADEDDLLVTLRQTAAIEILPEPAGGQI